MSVRRGKSVLRGQSCAPAENIPRVLSDNAATINIFLIVIAIVPPRLDVCNSSAFFRVGETGT
jgi:hypothetical protein